MPAARRGDPTVAFDAYAYDPEVWVSGNDGGTGATYVSRGSVTPVSSDRILF